MSGWRRDGRMLGDGLCRGSQLCSLGGLSVLQCRELAWCRLGCSGMRIVDMLVVDGEEKYDACDELLVAWGLEERFDGMD